jgi:hypothetical protein
LRRERNGMLMPMMVMVLVPRTVVMSRVSRVDKCILLDFIFLDDWEIGYKELIRKGIVCGMTAQLRKER